MKAVGAVSSTMGPAGRLASEERAAEVEARRRDLDRDLADLDAECTYAARIPRARRAIFPPRRADDAARRYPFVCRNLFFSSPNEQEGIASHDD